MQDPQNAPEDRRAPLDAGDGSRLRIIAALPVDLFEDVTAIVQPLTYLLPEQELRALVYRIAGVIRRREFDLQRRVAADDRGALRPASSDLDFTPETRTRLWDAARAYGKFLEVAVSGAYVVQQARRAREEAAATRAMVAADRARRAMEGEERARLREAVHDYVAQLKRHGDSLDAVLHTTGVLLRGLRITGDVADESGAFEVDVRRIVAEEYCSAA